MNGFNASLENVKQALSRLGRSDVIILAVTKKQPVERLQEAYGSGIRIFGVNYVQEGTKTRDVLRHSDIQWHFIGHIQSRKAKDLVTYDCIQSLDRIEVAQELNRLALAAKKRLSILLEINLGQEKQKSGIAAQELPRFLNSMQVLIGIQVTGLMAMPPALTPVEKRRPYFKEMRQLFERFQKEYGLDVLSMGTSDDYAIAVEEGATLIRLGRVLLGERI